MSHLALATQSQIPLRTGDCVNATEELEFFYKDEGEYERTHLIPIGTLGVMLNWGEAGPSDVEWLDPVTRQPIVSGAAFGHQFARVPWDQGQIQGLKRPTRDTADSSKPINDHTGDLCLEAHDVKGYHSVLRMSKCITADDMHGKAPVKMLSRWKQQFTFSRDQCGARPIRLTSDPSKCVDAVHPTKVLLTDCSGADSQKFLFRCDKSTKCDDEAIQCKADKFQGMVYPYPSGKTSEYVGEPECYIQAMGGRTDMCLWWDPDAGIDADLQIVSCNAFAQNQKRDDANTRSFQPGPLQIAEVQFASDGTTVKSHGRGAATANTPPTLLLDDQKLWKKEVRR
jgi:hypothetical protein